MRNIAPVNVKLKKPTIRLDNWDEDAQKWITINNDIKGNPNFYPLTVKGAYVIGVIHTICESVSILLNDSKAKLATYLPAYGVFASAIELLGRCINGNSSTIDTTNDLKSGFKWLGASYFKPYKNSYADVPDDIILVKTSIYDYSINNLVALRHFAAHGQATSKEVAKNSYAFGNIDYGILEQFPSLLANGLESYWHELQTSEVLCNNLAKADIIALRKLPVFLSWSMFEKDSKGIYHSVAEIFKRFSWKV